MKSNTDQGDVSNITVVVASDEKAAFIRYYRCPLYQSKSHWLHHVMIITFGDDGKSEGQIWQACR